VIVDVAVFIENTVASADFHLRRGSAEGQKYNRPLRTPLYFLRDEPSLNYILLFEMSTRRWRRSRVLHKRP
jgi:hypothetical protein